MGSLSQTRGLEVETNSLFWGKIWKHPSHAWLIASCISSPSSFLRGTLLGQRSQSTQLKTSVSQSPWDHEFEQKSAGDFRKSSSQLDRNSLPLLVSPVFFLLKLRSFCKVQRHSVRQGTSGYPGGALGPVGHMTLSPCHL